MRKITINEKEYTVVEKLTELNLYNFQQMSKIIDSDIDPYDKNIEMCKSLIIENITTDELDELEFDEIKYIINCINDDDTDYDDIKEVFQHDGVTYKLQGDAKNFKFKMKIIKKINSAMIEDKSFYVGVMASTLYDDDNTTDSRREIIFNEYMTVDYILPFIKILNEKYGS